MTNWDNDFMDEEVPAFIEFDAEGHGEFQFGYVTGSMDCRLGERDRLPEVQFSWEGTDKMDPVSGRGWALLQDGRLYGRLYFHGGDESEFTAAPFPKKTRAARKKPK